MPATWMVRAGRGGRYITEFRDENMVAIGWPEIGDVSALKVRSSFLDAFRSAYSEYRPQAQVVAAGQIYRFWREIKVGDNVVTYDPTARTYLIGTIASDARFDNSQPSSGLKTFRQVRWAKEKPKDDLSTTAQNSLGAILTLFSVNDSVASELSNVGSVTTENSIESEFEASSTSASFDAMSAAEISDIAAEVLKDRIAELDWEEMQELVAGLLRGMGFKTIISPSGPDRGKDIVASPDGLGLLEPKIVVEVKHRTGERIGAPQIRSFLGGRHPRDRCLYVSTGGFAREALYEADRAQIPITLIDFAQLVKWILEYYHKFDEQTRQLLPLTTFYWPISR